MERLTTSELHARQEAVQAVYKANVQNITLDYAKEGAKMVATWATFCAVLAITLRVVGGDIND